MQMSTNWGPRYSYMRETCLNPQTLLNESFCSPSFIPIFLCPVSPPLYPLRSPLPFKFLQMFFYLSAGDHQLSPTLLHSSPLALGLFLSLERAAASGKVGNQPGDSHSECFLAAFTCSHRENWQPLLHANLIRTCMYKESEQASNYLQKGMGIYFCACRRWIWAPMGFGRI